MDHLSRDRVNHISEFEPLLLRSHPGVIDDLKQEITEFVLQRIEVFPRDSVGDLVGLFDSVWSDSAKGLLHIPGTARHGIAQTCHDREEIFDSVPLRAAVSHPVRRI